MSTCTVVGKKFCGYTHRKVKFHFRADWEVYLTFINSIHALSYWITQGNHQRYKQKS